MLAKMGVRNAIELAAVLGAMPADPAGEMKTPGNSAGACVGPEARGESVLARST